MPRSGTCGGPGRRAHVPPRSIERKRRVPATSTQATSPDGAAMVAIDGSVIGVAAAVGLADAVGGTAVGVGAADVATEVGLGLGADADGAQPAMRRTMSARGTVLIISTSSWQSCRMSM